MISTEEPEDVFSKALEIELEKISSFYVAKEGELLDEVRQLLRDVGDQPVGTDGIGAPPQRPSVEGQRPTRIGSSGTIGSNSGSDEDADDSVSEEDETAGLTKSRRSGSGGRRKTVPNLLSQQTTDLGTSSEFGRSLRRHSTTMDDYGEQSLMFGSGLFSSAIMLKKRIISLYVQLCELKSYVQLNWTGFRKVLKKFDKILDKELKHAYLQAHVEPAYPFKDEIRKILEDKIMEMENAYTDVVTSGDKAMAKRDLRSHLREHVVWERNTVWRDLIGIERRGEAARLGQSLLGQDQALVPKRLQGDEDTTTNYKRIQTPMGRFKLPAWLVSSSMLTLLLSLLAFFLILFLPIMRVPEQQNCLAMLVFVSMLWATEVSFPSTLPFLNTDNTDS